MDDTIYDDLFKNYVETILKSSKEERKNELEVTEMVIKNDGKLHEPYKIFYDSIDNILDSLSSPYEYYIKNFLKKLKNIDNKENLEELLRRFSNNIQEYINKIKSFLSNFDQKYVKKYKEEFKIDDKINYYKQEIENNIEEIKNKLQKDYNKISSLDFSSISALKLSALAYYVEIDTLIDKIKGNLRDYLELAYGDIHDPNDKYATEKAIERTKLMYYIIRDIEKDSNKDKYPH